jgi:hypothetical protein
MFLGEVRPERQPGPLHLRCGNSVDHDDIELKKSGSARKS